MMSYVKLYMKFLVTNLKKITEFRADFLIGTVALVITQAVGLLFISVAFGKVKSIAGWEQDTVLLMFGFATSQIALSHIFLEGVWALGPRYIQTGNFDRIIVRPLDPLFQVVADFFQWSGLGNLVFGLALIFFALSNMGEISLMGIIILALFIVSGFLIYAGVTLFFATLSFWFIKINPVIRTVHALGEVTSYPVDIYPGPIRFLVKFVFPFAYSSYVPALFFTRPEFAGHLFLVPAVGVVCFSIAYGFFRWGMTFYRSTGS